MLNDNLSEREKEVLSLLSENPNLSVKAIGKELGVSEVTIRTYLQSLSRKGLILRTRGGAFPSFHRQILDHMKHNIEQKARIAKAAAALVQEGDRIMIGAGTTTALMLRYLTGKRDIQIVTNSALLIPYGRTNSSLKITLVGGDFVSFTESLVGPITLRELDQFYVRLAFIGTDGFSPQTGLTTDLVDGAEAVKKMAQKAKQCVLLADSSKFGKQGFVHFLPLAQIHKIITDTGLETGQADELRNICPDVLLV